MDVLVGTMYEKSSTPLRIEYCHPFGEIYYCVPTPVLSIVNLLAKFTIEYCHQFEDIPC